MLTVDLLLARRLARKKSVPRDTLTATDAIDPTIPQESLPPPLPPTTRGLGGFIASQVAYAGQVGQQMRAQAEQERQQQEAMAQQAYQQQQAQEWAGREMGIQQQRARNVSTGEEVARLQRMATQRDQDAAKEVEEVEQIAGEQLGAALQGVVDTQAPQAPQDTGAAGLFDRFLNVMEEGLAQRRAPNVSTPQGPAYAAPPPDRYQAAAEELGRPLTPTEMDFIKVAEERKRGVAEFQRSEQAVPPRGAAVSEAVGRAVEAAPGAILEAVDVPRQVFGKPAARVGQEAYARGVELTEPIQPARIPGVPEIPGLTTHLLSPEQARSGWMNEALSLVTDPLNAVPIAGFTKADDVVRGLRWLAKAGKNPEAREAAEQLLRRGGRLVTEGEAGFAKLPGEAGEAAAEVVPKVLLPEPPVDPADKLAGLIRAVKPVRAETEALYTAERGRRAGAIKGILGEPERYGPRETFQVAKGKAKGELPQAAFEPIEPQFVPEEIQPLFQRIHASDLDPTWEKLRAGDALEGLLKGRIPQENEIALLERVFGPQMGEALRTLKPGRSRLWQNIVEAANLPRAVMASYDLSAPARQGVMLGPAYPRQWAAAFKPMIKAWASEDGARAVDAAIRAKPTFGLQETANLYMAPLEGGSLMQREEAFISHLARRIPGIRRSERAFITYLNKLRSDVFDAVHYSWAQRGVKPSPRDYDDLAKFINYASGRGDLGSFNRAGPELAAAFFAPRYTVSRFQSWSMLWRASPQVRKEVARSLTAFVGSGVALLSLLKVSGAADVEVDPRSTDFGKIKIGPTRIDFWGGNQQIARTVAQFATGKRKGGGLGSIYPADRMTVFGRYVQGKLSPAAGLLLDVARGETFLGEEMALSGRSVKAQAFNRLAPMFLQDLTDAVKEQGALGLALAGPGVLGIGVQTYESAFQKLEQVRSEVSQERFGKPFEQLAEEGAEGVQPGFRSALAAIVDDERIARAEQEVEEDRARHGGDRRMADVSRVFRTEQQEADRDIPDNVQWRDNYNARRERMAGAFTEFLAGNPEKAAQLDKEREKLGDPFALEQDAGADTVVAAYMAVYDLHKTATGGIDDKDALYTDLDRFMAGLTAEQEAVLDANLGTTATARVKAYREDIAIIRESGYWEAADSTVRYLISQGKLPGEYNGVPITDFASFRAALEEDSRLRQVRPENSGAWKAYTKEVSSARVYFRENSPEIDTLLVKWYGLTPRTDVASLAVQEQTGLQVPAVAVGAGGGRPSRPSLPSRPSR